MRRSSGGAGVSAGAPQREGRVVGIPSGLALPCALSLQDLELHTVRTENENRKLWHVMCH